MTALGWITAALVTAALMAGAYFVGRGSVDRQDTVKVDLPYCVRHPSALGC